MNTPSLTNIFQAKDEQPNNVAIFGERVMKDKRKKISKEEQEQILQAKHEFDREQLTNTCKQLHLVKHNMKKYSSFKNSLKFISQYEDMIRSAETKQRD